MIARRFVIKRRIPKRYHCDVYTAYDKLSKSHRCLLVMPKRIRTDPEALAFVKQTASHLRALDHPAIVAIYGFHETATTAFLELEHAEGRSLEEIRNDSEEKRLSVRRVHPWAVELLQALAYAHNNNLLHRDLNPLNILLDNDNRIRLLDFGLNYAIQKALKDAGGEPASDVSGFRAPEQITESQMTVRSDIYAFGAVWYYLLGGSLNNLPTSRAEAHREISAIGDLSPGYNRILRKCLAWDASERYHDCESLLEELQALELPSAVPLEKPQPEPPVLEETKDVDSAAFPFSDKRILKGKRAFMRRLGSLNKSIIITAGAMIVLICMLFLIPDDPNGHEPDQRAENSESRSDPFTEANRLQKALLKAADSLYKARQLIRPAGHNALEFYRQLRKTSINNQTVDRRIDSVRLSVLDQIEKLMASGRYYQAQTLVSAAIEQFPGETAFLDLKESILKRLNTPAAPEQMKLEILNGMGKQGLAHAWAENFEKQGYRITRVENYRNNGAVDWSVRQSRMVSHIGDNHQLKRLSEQINLPYTIELKRASDLASPHATLILGSDYNELKQPD